jgi:hypothetical protein
VDRADRITGDKTLETPSTSIGKPAAILLHHAKNLALTLGNRVVGIYGFEAVKDYDRTIWKRTCFVAFERGRICVDVMYPGLGIEKRVSGQDYLTLDVHPSAIAGRLIDVRLIGGEKRGRHSQGEKDQQTCAEKLHSLKLNYSSSPLARC